MSDVNEHKVAPPIKEAELRQENARLRSEVEELLGVLAWSDENLFAAARLMKPPRGPGGWSVTVNVYNPNNIKSETLYGALKKAWGER